ncbi:MAG TPA: phage tail tube protein [Gemmatimonadales bacterium]|nr:phage tail tube protein [Gemmatimonadales bacterium]
MAFTEPSHAYEMLWRFSTKRQTAMGTALGDGELSLSALVSGFEAGQLAHRLIPNADRFGKGHPYTTAHRKVAQRTSLQRTVELTDTLAGWVAAFCLGSVASSQPNPGGNPTVYDHVMKWSDLAASKAMPFTTIHEKPWAGLARKLPDMVVAGFTLAGRGQEAVQLSVRMMGSGRAADAPMSAPAIPPAAYLDNGGTVILLGPPGAPVDVSSRVVEWSAAVEANPDEAGGRFPSSGLYVGRWWYGAKRTAVPELTLLVNQSDADLLDLFRNDAAQELRINIGGAVITPGQPETYRMNLLWPEIHFTAVEDTVADGKVALRMSVGPDGVFLRAGSEIFQITVTNTTPSYLTT